MVVGVGEVNPYNLKVSLFASCVVCFLCLFSSLSSLGLGRRLVMEIYTIFPPHRLVCVLCAFCVCFLLCLLLIGVGVHDGNLSIFCLIVGLDMCVVCFLCLFSSLSSLGGCGVAE